MTIYTDNSSAVKIFSLLNELNCNHAYAICFNLSNLANKNKNKYQIKIALNVLNDSLKKYNGYIFLLNNNDIISIFETKDNNLIEKVTHQLRYLFIDDPLSFHKNNEKNSQFSTTYVLNIQKDSFVDHINKFLAPEEQMKINTASSKFSKVNNKFMYVDDALKDVDLLPMIRRKKVCIAIKDRNIKPIFEEIYINTSSLKNFLKIDYDKLENRLVNKYFEDTIQEKLFDILHKNIDETIVGATNINLNIDLVLSDEFMKFHKLLRSKTNSSFIIDFDVADIFMDLNAFYYANNFLKDLGYKTCIDVVDSYYLSHINRESLGFDLLKIHWDFDKDGEIERSILKKFINKANPNRVILTHCEEEESIDYGRSLGVFLFQGWHLERQLQKKYV